MMIGNLLVWMVLLSSGSTTQLSDSGMPRVRRADFLARECREALTAAAATRTQSSASVDYRAVGDCIGYIRGLMDGLMILSIFKPGVLCMEKDVSGEQGIRIFLRYMDDHPERGNGDMADIVGVALMEAFPCP